MNRYQVSRSFTILIAVILSLAGPILAGEIKGTVTVHGMRSAENIAVYVDVIAGKNFDPPPQHLVIDQRKMTFIPHVLVVLKGTTVDFLNSDPVGHNVYWPSISHNKKLAHNLGTWPQGVKKSFQFNDPGVAPLLCNVHPEMSGYVVVVQTPYFAVTDKEGHYTIKDVPAGNYTLKTWSEEGKPVTQSVNVSSGSVNADLSVQR
jgi:plastocyanin